MQQQQQQPLTIRREQVSSCCAMQDQGTGSSSGLDHLVSSICALAREDHGIAQDRVVLLGSPMLFGQQPPSAERLHPLDRGFSCSDKNLNLKLRSRCSSEPSLDNDYYCDQNRAIKEDASGRLDRIETRLAATERISLRQADNSSSFRRSRWANGKKKHGKHGKAAVYPFRYSSSLLEDSLKKASDPDERQQLMSESVFISKCQSWPSQMDSSSELQWRWGSPTTTGTTKAIHDSTESSPSVVGQNTADDQRRWSGVTEVARNPIFSSMRSLETATAEQEGSIRLVEQQDRPVSTLAEHIMATSADLLQASLVSLDDCRSLHSWSSELSSLGMGSCCTPDDGSDDLLAGTTSSSPPRTSTSSTHSLFQRMNTTLRGKCMRIVEDTSPRRPLRRRSRSPDPNRFGLKGHAGFFKL